MKHGEEARNPIGTRTVGANPILSRDANQPLRALQEKIEVLRICFLLV